MAFPHRYLQVNESGEAQDWISVERETLVTAATVGDLGDRVLMAMALPNASNDYMDALIQVYVADRIPTGEESVTYSVRAHNWHNNPSVWMFQQIAGLPDGLRGYVDLLIEIGLAELYDEVFSEVFLSSWAPLQELINIQRNRYQMELAPAPDEVVQYFRYDEMVGGNLYGAASDGEFYRVRYPMRSGSGINGENHVGPWMTEDPYHVRFLPFNQGPMQSPPANVTWERVIETDINTMSSVKIHLDLEKHYLYIIPQDGMTLENLTRFKFFAIEGEGVHLIGKINYRDEWTPSYDLSVHGWRIGFGREWLVGHRDYREYRDGLTVNVKLCLELSDV